MNALTSLDVVAMTSIDVIVLVRVDAIVLASFNVIIMASSDVMLIVTIIQSLLSSISILLCDYSDDDAYDGTLTRTGSGQVAMTVSTMPRMLRGLTVAVARSL